MDAEKLLWNKSKWTSHFVGGLITQSVYGSAISYYYRKGWSIHLMCEFVLFEFISHKTNCNKYASLHTACVSIICFQYQLIRPKYMHS